MIVCLAPNGQEVFQGSNAPTRLFVGTMDGVIALDREASGEWKVAARALQGCHISALHREPTRAGLFAAVHHGGLYRSLDAGDTWESSLKVEHAYSVASARQNGAVLLYAGTEPPHLFRSTDYGETWKELPSLSSVPGTESWMFPEPPHVAHVKDIKVDPRDPSTLYVAVEQGALLKSVDGGETWRELSGYYKPDVHEAYKDVHRLALSPSNPDVIYMTNGDGLFWSPDAGDTWEQLTDRSMRVGYPDGLLISPLDDKVLFMSGGINHPGNWRSTHTADSCVAHSRDGGRNWTVLKRGFPDHLRGNIEALSMGVWPGGFTLFAGTVEGEVYFSEDQGESWSRIAAGLPRVSKGGHYRSFVEAS